MTMLRVTVGNNVKRENVTVTNQTTLRTVLEQQGMDITRGNLTLDGATLPAGSLDRTFESFGITEKCFLMQIVKADNAVDLQVVKAI